MTRPDQVQSPANAQRTPPYKLVGLILLLICLAITAVVYTQFRGGFTKTTGSP